MYKKLLFLLILLFLAGCGGGVDVPKWYINHKQDNSRFIYASGEGMSKIDAINSALSFAASKVSVTINSTFATSKEYIQTNSNTNSFRQLRQETTSNIKNIEFSDYNVIKTASNKGRYYVLIQIDKIKNAEILFSKAKNDINDVKNYLYLKDRIKILTLYPKLIKRIKKDIYNLYIAQTLYPNIPGINTVIQQALELKFKLTQKLNSITLQIKCSNAKLKNILHEVFTKLNIPISNRGITVNGSIVKNRKKIAQFYITTMSVNISLSDKTSIEFNVKCGGKSFSDFGLSDQFAYKNCEKKLEEKFKELLN